MYSRRLVFLFTMILLINVHVNAQRSKEKISHVKIGLLVNNQNKEISQYGAQKAIKEINEQGGIQGKPVELIIKSIEGDWGSGSREIVDLVFKENVSAIIGVIDGENSHLAEQVIAKTQLTYISAWATDPTLSKAYVPWYFSIVPTDEQQAVAIIQDIKSRKGLEKVLLIHDESYDTKLAIKSVYEVSANYMDLSLSYTVYDEMDPDILLSGVKNNEWEALIFLGRNFPVSQYLNVIEASDKSIPVYTNLSFLGSRESEGHRIKFYELFYGINSAFALSAETDKKSIDSLADPPFISDAIAAYSYDGTMLLAEALRKSFEEGDSLEKIMSKIHYQGITGDIEFDGLGRLKKSVELQIFKP